MSVLSNTGIRAGASAAGGGSSSKYVEEVFSIDLYDGNGGTQSINNGIDLDGEGGLVWIKTRDDTSFGHQLYDTERGTSSNLSTQSTAAAGGTSSRVTAFNEDGFDLGANGATNDSSSTYSSFTFRKQKGFFDIVKYEGSTSSQTIAHNLGCVPGVVIVKSTDADADWFVYHKSVGETKALFLSESNAENDDVYWNDTAPTSTHFTVGPNGLNINEDGKNYIVYLFADGDDSDAQIFGENEDESIIKCGTYEGTGSSTNLVHDLGWEPQWIMVKNADQSTSADWLIFDTYNRWYAEQTGNNDSFGIRVNTDAAEQSINRFHILSDGFKTRGEGSNYVNSNGDTFVYVAIRRGKMKKPEAGTEVFQALAFTGSGSDVKRDLDIEPDAIWQMRRGSGTPYWHDRSRHGQMYISTWGSATEGGTITNEDSIYQWGQDHIKVGDAGHVNGSESFIYHIFTRARGFFDIATYVGDSSTNHGVRHNLGVAPEFIMVHTRASSDHWYSYHKDASATPLTHYMAPSANDFASYGGTGTMWGSTAHSDSHFYVGGWDASNHNGEPMIAYLWANLDGICSIGSYTGNGGVGNGLVEVDCGFSAGARYVMVKNKDASSDWFIFDTTRGINYGDDPYVDMNTGDAEVTNKDYIKPLSTGFYVLPDGGNSPINTTDDFIYLAIA